MYPLVFVLGEALTITIGAGGAGGAINNNGSAGGNSSVVGGTSGNSLTLYAAVPGGLKGNGTAGGNGGGWRGGSSVVGGSGGANGVAGSYVDTTTFAGGTYQIPFSPCVAKFATGGGGGGLGADGGFSISAKNSEVGNAHGGAGGASGGGGGGGGGTPWGKGGIGGSNGAAGNAPAANEYGAGGGGGSGNSAGGDGSAGMLWLIWYEDAWNATNDRAALGMTSANLDTQLSAIAGYLDTEVAAIKAKTDNLPADTNTLLTSTGIKVASIANGVIAAATFAAGALDAVWSVATRTLTAIADSSGITTLLSRIIGTLATGTHQPQSGDTYARLGAPSGASVSADMAAIDAAVSGLHDFDPATDTVAHVTLVDTVTTLTNSPDVPTEAEIADAVRVELAPELASITAMEDRLEAQVATGPVVVIPAPPPGQTAAWTLCLDPSGQPDPGARVYLQMTTAGSGTGVALDPGMLEGIADGDGIATILIPRRAGPQYQVWRGQGARVTVTGVDAETLALPTLMGSP